MNYVRLHIHFPEAIQELLIAELMDYDFEGFEQERDLLIASIPQQRFDDVKREEIERLVMSYEGGEFVKEELVEPQNWNKNWEDSIQAQYIGDFVVRPTWADGDLPEEGIEILIDPKMAFGTGYHATTRLILAWLPEIIKDDVSVLDAGTGTGILSIAAIKLGASYAFGFDIDDWSKINAEENAILNKVTDECDFELGSIETIPEGEVYDVVLGNINRNALIELLPTLVSKVAPGGDLIISGLLEDDADTILALHALKSATHRETRQEKEWIAMWFTL